MKKDIETIDDIKVMVDRFYDKLLVSEPINRHFLPLNLEQHLPIVHEFWNTILLGSMTYKRNMMDAHQRIQFTNEDFYTWLRLLEETLKENYEGPVAEEALTRANVIALTMRAKLMDE